MHLHFHSLATSDVHDWWLIIKSYNSQLEISRQFYFSYWLSISILFFDCDRFTLLGVLAWNSRVYYGADDIIRPISDIFAIILVIQSIWLEPWISRKKFKCAHKGNFSKIWSQLSFFQKDFKYLTWHAGIIPNTEPCAGFSQRIT